MHHPNRWLRMGFLKHQQYQWPRQAFSVLPLFAVFGLALGWNQARCHICLEAGPVFLRHKSLGREDHIPKRSLLKPLDLNHKFSSSTLEIMKTMTFSCSIFSLCSIFPTFGGWHFSPLAKPVVSTLVSFSQGKKSSRFGPGMLQVWACGSLTVWIFSSRVVATPRKWRYYMYYCMYFLFCWWEIFRFLSCFLDVCGKI